MPTSRAAVFARDSVPFGFTFDGHGRLVITDAGANAVLTFAIHRDGKVVGIGAP